MPETRIEFLTLSDRRLAYHRRQGRPGAPGVVFCSGYGSNMMGMKAEFLDGRCAEAGLSFLRFDYRGHGQSSGNFTDGTIGGWFEDACLVFERLTEGLQIVVGSSMGGWMGLMLALKQPHRVRAFIGIASAPDFTENLLLPALTAEEQTRLEQEGLIYRHATPPDEPLPVTKQLVEEARNHLVLRGPLAVTCPLRLLHGMQDADVPWQHALRIAEIVPHGDARIALVKDGAHRLSRPQDLELLWRTIEEFI